MMMMTMTTAVVTTMAAVATMIRDQLVLLQKL